MGIIFAFVFASAFAFDFDLFLGAFELGGSSKSSIPLEKSWIGFRLGSGGAIISRRQYEKLRIPISILRMRSFLA